MTCVSGVRPFISAEHQMPRCATVLEDRDLIDVASLPCHGLAAVRRFPTRQTQWVGAETSAERRGRGAHNERFSARIDQSILTILNWAEPYNDLSDRSSVSRFVTVIIPGRRAATELQALVYDIRGMRCRKAMLGVWRPG